MTFDPTVALSDLLQFAFFVALIVAAVVHMDRRITRLEGKVDSLVAAYWSDKKDRHG